MGTRSSSRPFLRNSKSPIRLKWVSCLSKCKKSKKITKHTSMSRQRVSINKKSKCSESRLSLPLN